MNKEVIKQDFVRKIGEMKLRLLEREKLEKELVRFLEKFLTY